ncbi:unnamed protein product [Blepharisma stoltei]|uniref:Uncharacterized protein n=1 Tax=Blepharisma stoltei TaxID=1481888 RepID=A0AAU9IZA8_9CILI|nr:unnamed protein product [Blepharisma stoltei]
MGCGLPSKRVNSKKEQEEDEDTSLRDHPDNSSSFYTQHKFFHPAESSFNYTVHGAKYRITVELISTPEKSLVMS